MGLGSVLGYLAAGIIIGPVMGLVGSETAELEQEMESAFLSLRFGNQDAGTA
jgi:CPA2 family monovalent cation:H+ antiporter-2